MAPFVGLTGGLGAGKSEALRLLGELGAATLSTDAVVHELLATRRAARPARRAARARGRPAACSTAPRSPSGSSATTTRAPGSRACCGRAWASGWRRGAPSRAVRPGGGRRGAAAVRVRHGGRLRRDDRRVADEAIREERAAARGHAAVAERAGRQLSQDGKGAESGLHGPQRRLAGRVEADAVPRTCETRDRPVSSQAARIARRPSRARVAAAAPDRSWRAGRRPRAASSAASSTGAGPLERRGARDHAAAAPRGHHPPAGRRQGPRPGADRRRDLRGVALPRPDLARGRARADADHARRPPTSSPAARAASASSRPTSPRRRSTSPTAPGSCAT